MGIWDDFSPFTSAISGGTALAIGANVGGAFLASEGARRGAQAQVEANERAQQTLDAIRQQSQPGISYLRQVVADPGSLTPAQQQALNDSRLSTSNALNSSSFAGSGRAGAALLQRNESDFVNKALEDNRARAIQAGTTLAGENTTAGTGIANSQTASGKAVGGAEEKAGLYGGQALVASGNVAGKAIGDVGSYIASQSKLSRYGNTKPANTDGSGFRGSSYDSTSGNADSNSAPAYATKPTADQDWA